MRLVTFIIKYNKLKDFKLMNIFNKSVDGSYDYFTDNGALIYIRKDDIDIQLSTVK